MCSSAAKWLHPSGVRFCLTSIMAAASVCRTRGAPRWLVCLAQAKPQTVTVSVTGEMMPAPLATIVALLQARRGDVASRLSRWMDGGDSASVLDNSPRLKLPARPARSALPSFVRAPTAEPYPPSVATMPLSSIVAAVSKNSTNAGTMAVMPLVLASVGITSYARYAASHAPAESKTRDLEHEREEQLHQHVALAWKGAR
ncbi:hypothetical protein PHYPSEUDO_001170 [Phytophthora pseudosyringae]|uniref:Transmembrane protein n=1 Tax=Phytophthora pseudosyringae TaxID=221518 RepID=A0A8T1VXP8_9STRA|nr:hypothetical protein PHYPSEUDO_001170 [Phytophthora pseudosyringae]